MSALSSLTRDAKLLVGIFTASGTVHLVRPQTFEPLMPSFVPAHREVIYASGVLELACAAALLHPGTRRAAGWVSLAVLLGVYPANVKMAADAVKSHNTTFKAAAFGRLPLQLPMLRAALRVAREQ
jgi:uncharacterized membrane protein